MTARLTSPDAAPASNTRPLVEPDGSGGHIPYVRLDTSPSIDYPPAQAAIIGLLGEILFALRAIRDESRATRIGIQTLLNDGGLMDHDLVEMADALKPDDEDS